MKRSCGMSSSLLSCVCFCLCCSECSTGAQSPTHLLADPYAMLLSNLTKLDSVCSTLLKLEMEGSKAIVSLAETFVKGDAQAFNTNASYHFLASVLANLSVVRLLPTLTSIRDAYDAQSPAGRQALLARPSGAEPCPLARIAVFTEHPDPIRRGGAAVCIK